MRTEKRPERPASRKLWLALLCAAAAVGCAGSFREPAGARLPANLPPPRLVDDSLTCEVLRDPELVYREQPDYPAEARKFKSSGEVVVRVIVTREGTLRDPRVVRASNAVFIDPVLSAVQRWRYQPATCDGVPVEMIFYIYSEFRVK